MGDAQFGSAFGRVGLAPDCALLWTLPRRVGLGATKGLVLRSAVVVADTALGVGLVDSVVASGGACERAMDLAARAPLVLAATKRLLAGSA